MVSKNGAASDTAVADEFDLTIHDLEGDDLLRSLWAEMRQLRIDMGPMLTHFANVYAESAGEVEPTLPLGFPGREILATNGITAVDQIPRSSKGIERLNGMDSDTAWEIVATMARMVKK